MTHSNTPKAQGSEVDIAYQLLLDQGRSRNYYDLIQDVLKLKNLEMEPDRVSAVLTQINMDSRFTYLGKGEWGLRAWTPSRSPRKSSSSVNLLNKESVNEDDEADLEDEEEKLLLDDSEEDSDSFENDDSYEKPSHRSDEDSWN